jgi:hypothetical protein
MSEIKMLNELLKNSNGRNLTQEHINKVSFYVETNEILDTYPCFLNITYSNNTLYPIINQIKMNYDSNGLYDNIVLKIIVHVEQMKTFLCLDEADYFIILHKDKCIAKLDNLNNKNSNRSMCIDITELLIIMNKTRYNQELLNCVKN